MKIGIHRVSTNENRYSFGFIGIMKRPAGTASPHEVSSARRSAACNRGEVSLLFPVAA